MPILKNIHHVQLTVPKGCEEEAQRFYCQVLGLGHIEKPEVLKKNGGFWLQLGQQQIHVGVEDGIDRFATKAHIAYEVENLQQWRSYLTEKGINIIESVVIPGCKRFELRDPFGNRIELIETA